jgi:hypothetical protein
MFISMFNSMFISMFNSMFISMFNSMFNCMCSPPSSHSPMPTPR